MKNQDMKNRDLYLELNRLRTTDLLIRKMGCTQQIAFFSSLRLALLGLNGLLVGQIAKTLFSSKTMALVDIISIPLVIYCMIAFHLLNAVHSSLVGEKELIGDLLTFRQNKSKGKS